MIRQAIKIVPLVLLAALAVWGWIAFHPGASAAPKLQSGAAAPTVVRKLVNLSDWYHAALVDKSQISDPHQLEPLAKQICEGQTVCAVAIWYDEQNLPQSLPVHLEQQTEQQFRFGRNAEGKEDSSWNCDKYPEFMAAKACLPKAIGPDGVVP